MRSVRQPLAITLAALGLALGASLDPTVAAAQAAPTPATPATPVAAPTTPAHAHTRDEVLELGRATVRRVFNNALDSLVDTADPSTGSVESVRQRVGDALPQVAMQLGPEVKLIGEKVMRVNGRVEYWRTAEYTMVPVPLVFRVVMGDVQGRWRGFTAAPEEALPAGEEITPND